MEREQQRPDDEGSGQQDRVPSAVPWFRRLRTVVPVIAVLVGLTGVGVWRWTNDPDRRLGPDPTVDGVECGLGLAPASILSLDGETGALRWSRLVGAGDAPGPNELALAAGTVAVSTEGGVVQGLTVNEGTHRWCAEGEIVSGSGDRLFTVRDDAVVELDADSGAMEPVAPDVLPTLLERQAGPMAVRGESLAYPGQGLTITASDRATGEDLWSREVPGYQFVATHDLVIVNDQTNGTFTMSSAPGDLADHFTVSAYDLATGEDAWSIQVPRFGELFLAGEHILLKGWDDGEVRALDAETGRVLWAVEHDHPGRTGRYSEPGELTAVATDSRTGDLFVLLVSSRPYRG